MPDFVLHPDFVQSLGWVALALAAALVLFESGDALRKLRRK